MNYELIQYLEDNLKPQESYIIIKRFGLDDDKPMTLQALGTFFGVTREYIRQIQNRALNKIKKSKQDLLNIVD